MIDDDGLEIDKVGPIVSTVKVLLGPADDARFPNESTAVPEAIEIPNVPFPVIPEILTVLVEGPVPETDTVPLAVPVLFKVTLLELKVINVASVYEIV